MRGLLSSPSPFTRRWLDARQLIAGLALVVAALAMLGYWAWQASVRRHEVSIDLLRSHADLAAQRLGARMQNELYVGGMAIFRPVTANRTEVSGLVEPTAILAAARTAEECRCVPPMRPVYALRTDLTLAGTVFAGAAPASSRERGAIVGAMREQMTRMPTGWDIAVLRGDSIRDGRVLLFTRTGPTQYLAFATDSATLREFIVFPLLCTTRLVTAAGDPRTNPNDSLVAFRIADAGGAELFRSAAAVDSALASTTRASIEWGELAVTASLRPRATALILPGGAPRSPVPILLALLATAATLVGLAVLLLWRMHELSRLRTDFTSSVSHELRTPLTQILLYAETIEMGRQRSRAKRAEAIGVITRETRRLIHLVENVLQFSRAERRLTRLSPRPQELGEVVAETVTGFLPVAEARRSSVALRVAAPVLATIDANAVRRILLNLLDNAVRYGPDGQTVTVAVERVGPWARLTVEDEGPGVAAGRRDDVWRPFVRIESDKDESTTGCGIGLAIVSELVTLHSGRRSVAARAGGGAAFVIELPAADGRVGHASPEVADAPELPLGAGVT